MSNGLCIKLVRDPDEYNVSYEDFIIEACRIATMLGVKVCFKQDTLGGKETVVIKPHTDPKIILLRRGYRI